MLIPAHPAAAGPCSPSCRGSLLTQLPQVPAHTNCRRSLLTQLPQVPAHTNCRRSLLTQLPQVPAHTSCRRSLHTPAAVGPCSPSCRSSLLTQLPQVPAHPAAAVPCSHQLLHCRVVRCRASAVLDIVICCCLVQNATAVTGSDWPISTQHMQLIRN